MLLLSSPGLKRFQARCCLMTAIAATPSLLQPSLLQSLQSAQMAQLKTPHRSRCRVCRAAFLAAVQLLMLYVPLSSGPRINNPLQAAQQVRAHRAAAPAAKPVQGS